MTIDGPIARILVPTDFSSGSKRAWSMARRLADALGAELLLLHVLPNTPLEMRTRYAEEEARAAERARQAEHQLGIPRDADELPPLPHTFRGPFTEEHVSEFSSAGRQWAAMLEEWAAYAQHDGCKVITLLRVGSPYEQIVTAAKDEDAGLVVMATHGRGEVRRLLLGSVADKVIRLASCPVLTVKDSGR
jgi:nucleotide-binding universal stress UspA family protein